jgi:hypothetical protein
MQMTNGGYKSFSSHVRNGILEVEAGPACKCGNPSDLVSTERDENYYILTCYKCWAYGAGNHDLHSEKTILDVLGVAPEPVGKTFFEGYTCCR